MLLSRLGMANSLLSERRHYISLRAAFEFCAVRRGASMKKKELMRLLHDLQSQTAFQDDTLQSLQTALATQQKDLLVLQRQLMLLKQRQDEQGAGLNDDPAPAQELPPHY